MGKSEHAVEEHLRLEVLRLGGMCEKIAPTRKGLPDRMVILPNGQIWLVEVKTAEGRTSPAQDHWIGKARALGAPVSIVYGTDDVDQLLDRWQMLGITRRIYPWGGDTGTDLREDDINDG